MESAETVQHKGKFRLSDAWWLTAGVLGVASQLITFILRTDAAERTGWILYLTAWIPSSPVSSTTRPAATSEPSTTHAWHPCRCCLSARS